jgi:WD40 repeat protein
LTRAEWLVYAGQLMLAQVNFEADNGGLALHYLDQCQVNLRGWEHRYLSARINAKQTLLGHKGAVSSVAFSLDGQRIVTGSEDQTAKVWDAATGRELLALKGHTHMVTSVAFSPDGKRIITGAGDWSSPDTRPGEAKVWDAATGQEVLALKGHTDCVWNVAFSPDGKRIVTGSEDQTARVWDAATGQEILTLKGHAGGCAAWRSAPTAGASSPAGRLYGKSVGRPRRARKSSLSRGTRAGCAAWRSAPTAGALSLPVGTGRQRCGTPGRAGKSSCSMSTPSQ